MPHQFEAMCGAWWSDDVARKVHAIAHDYKELRKIEGVRRSIEHQQCWNLDR